MLRTNLFLFILNSCFCLLNAQKHDNNWISGISSNGTQITGIQMSFSDSSVSYNQRVINIEMIDYPVTISDRDGNLIFYTNGNVIASHNHQVMENSKGLNEGAQMDDFHQFMPDTTYNIQYIDFTYMVVPDPIDLHIYYLIHFYIVQGPAPGYVYASSKIQCTKIDMNQNNGLGKVIYKNKVIHSGMTGPSINMVKHGNGADWWIVTRSLDGLYYNTFHLSRDTIIHMNIQELYNPDNIAKNLSDSVTISRGGITISPDGTKILDRYYNDSARYLDFDRCTGLVSLIDTFAIGLDSFLFFNPSSQQYEYKTSSLLMMVFSPDNRFMYGGTVGGYSQWDLHAEDIIASRVHLTGPPYDIGKDVGVNYNNVFTPNFVNAPDGKIYGLYHEIHHIINEPNKKGTECDFCYAPDLDPPTCIGFFTPVSYLYSPWIPNYRLGPLEGSACDTISTLSDLPYTSKYQLNLYPNPSNGPLHVNITLPEYSNKETSLEMVDALGRKIYNHTFVPYSYLHTIDTSLFPSGIYFIRLINNGHQVAMEKVIVE